MLQSYGGFVTSHVLGDTHIMVPCGIAVAPVTDWRYYGKVFPSHIYKAHF